MKSRHVRAGAAALMVAFSLALAACGGADARRISHMARGQEYFDAENFEKARVEYQNALQIAPNDPEARFMTGRVAERLGNVRAAVAQYQSTIDVAPDHVQARANLGRVYVFGGAPDKAMEIIAPAIAKHPTDPDLLAVRAAAKAQLKDQPGALVDAQKAHDVAPDSEAAIALLASLYRQSGDDAKAMALLQESIKRLPKSVDLRQIVATMHAEAREPDAAIEQLRKIIELRPADMAYRTQLAIYLVRLKRVDEADQVLRAAVDRDPKNNAALLSYVDFVTAQRSVERGVEVLKEYIALDPSNLDLQLGLGMTYQRGGDAPAAIATFRKVIEQDDKGPKGLTARNRIAAMDAAGGRFDDAMKLVAAVLERNPGDNDALVLRGNIRLQRGDAPGAIADLRAVLRDQPAAAPLLRTLARAHMANAEPALAEESLRAAMEAAPTDREVRGDLAQMLIQSGRVEQGVTLLEEAVRSAPDDAVVREALVRAYIARSDLDAARNAAEDLQVLSPKAASGFHLAALIAQQQGRSKEAERDYERALALQPTAIDSLAGLVRLDLDRKDSDKALSRVQALMKAQGENALTLNLLGEIHISRKEYPQAIAALGSAVKKAPAWWMPRRNLALTQFGAGDIPGGIRTLEVGLSETGYALPIVSDLGSMYERQKRPDDAIRLYEELYKRNPRLELAANNLAMLLVTYRTDPASLDRARDLTAGFANSSMGPFIDTFGWVRLKRGEVTQALPALERAAQLNPESRVIRYHLGMAQKAAGQKERARETLEAAVDGAQGFAGLAEARTALLELSDRGGSSG